MENSVQIHRREAPSNVRCMILTLSDTRTAETDKSGQSIWQLLEEAGHTVAAYSIVKDDKAGIQELLLQAVRNPAIEAVLMNGGTGIAPRDNAYEAVKEILDKEMHGFGEIFRYLSFTEDIGTAAILSRAIAGVKERTAIFSMPGSTGAVKLAMTRIILPELGHVMREIYKQP
ncbi:molybdenum cofactor biosynthesis protein B [Paenibacillus sp. YN15]|uniref:MogA/MoaB family molybdenum cofactor biosynthesis protein n=1 Tax=Paenibacillus sp. YN15 TaxID=1742774 RepID=UPI000DCE0DC1|nr:molybdenum cofactor biosynthesis protein B [Paenibacillus sp. YN15]RAV06443.1 molybdenum cofactor biosynthesis protein [Paenibacillus sp. YN15]